MIFTEEEFAVLKKADRSLKTYHYGQYVSGCPQATAKKLLTIYRRVTNDSTKICTNCSGGIAIIFKKLAPMYLEALAEEEKAQKQRRKKKI